jgi:hypothetical protein
MNRRSRQVEEPESDGLPPVATGVMLHGDPMVAASQRQAVPTAKTHGGGVPAALIGEPGVPVVIRHASNDEWVPLMLAIPLGKAVEILGRDEQRETVDITNQTMAITGQTALLFLFGDEQQAQNFADDPAANQAARLGQGVRMAILPDGAGRTFTHTASVWAVAYDPGGGAPGGIAILDVSAERKSRYRR